MIVSINQPAYLPWLGYFHRIAVSDLHIVLDHVQFEKNSFCNRNKIRVGNEALWLTVPVQTKGHFGDLAIHKLQFAENIPWQKKHWNSLRMNYSSAPYFSQYAASYESIYNHSWPSFMPMVRAFLKQHLEHLGIKTPLQFSSEMNAEGNKSDLVLNLCRKVSAKTYFSGALGKDYLDEKGFDENGIRVLYQEYHHPVYEQKKSGFISNLGILDLLFHHGPRSLELLLENNQNF